MEIISCEKLKTWLKKCSDDSETSNWLNANTKDCPQCQVTIEKDGGCNHMTCKNLACKFEFCWMCLGPWAPHVSGSGWYSCNRYDDDAARRARDAQERSRAALQRYLHYYMRYTNHQNSLKLERKMLGFSWIETQFLQKAVEVLIECRRTLMYTYVFAFYLVQNNITKLFEDNQSDLELATEQLSEYLERELPNEKVAEVQDKYRYVEQRRQTLLKHCVEGHEHNEWKFCQATLDNKVEFKLVTRSGAPPPKLIVRKDKDVPIHRVNDPMSLQLHMADERVRTAGLSPAEREWREKWIHDQNMHPDEPVHVDAVHRQLNPIRVLYRWPWDKLYKHFLRPTFGTFYATIIRLIVPKYCWMFLTVETIYYIWKYESKSWQKTSGIETINLATRYALVKEHDKETIKLGYTDYGRHDYYDRDFYENYKTADIDLGPSKRPCLMEVREAINLASNEREGGGKILQLNLAPSSEEDPRTQTRRTIFGTYVVLIIPVATFALGCWQWERHKWKTELIEKMKKAAKTESVEFPVDNLSALEDLEFRKVRIRGFYLYDRQFVIRWRRRVDIANAGISNTENYGAYVVTPMRLQGTNLIIMVNRGWVATESIDLELEKGKQRPESELKELSAIVRRSEKGSPFVRNDPERGIWAYKDLDDMGRRCGASPVIVDADFESTEKDGPIGGQTNVALRNQHYSYMVQWFGLSAAVLGMWSLQFL
uniref:NADH dehydrogenase [ubiquinone] 1 beta subcomplex subunit 6 n=1 Tax=Globodera pallida TaxID=36090 RepID=A0A183BVU2_GLOPA